MLKNSRMQTTKKWNKKEKRPRWSNTTHTTKKILQQATSLKGNNAQALSSTDQRYFVFPLDKVRIHKNNAFNKNIIIYNQLRL
jgi:hypothetical protein